MNHTVEELKAIRDKCMRTLCWACEHKKGHENCKYLTWCIPKCFMSPCYWTDKDINRMAQEEHSEQETTQK